MVRKHQGKKEWIVSQESDREGGSEGGREGGRDSLRGFYLLAGSPIIQSPRPSFPLHVLRQRAKAGRRRPA
jgi:hypothetical protein